MSDVLSSDDLDALAAEYVLGTLDTEERRGATALLEVDHAFRGSVRIWERRLSELHLMVEPVEPDAKILERIKAKIGGVQQIPISEEAPLPQPAKPEAAEAKAASESNPAEAAAGEAKPEVGEAKPAEADQGEVKPEEAKPETAQTTLAVVEIAWPEGEPKPPTLVPEESAAKPEEPPARPPEPPPRPVTRRGAAVAEPPARVRTGRGWQISTAVMTLAALALAALIGAWRYFPERLPPQLRATTVLHMPVPPVPPMPAPRRVPPPPFDE